MGCVRRMMTGQGRDEGRVLEDRLQIDGPMYTSRVINTGSSAGVYGGRLTIYPVQHLAATPLPPLEV